MVLARQRLQPRASRIQAGMLGHLAASGYILLLSLGFSDDVRRQRPKPVTKVKARFGLASQLRDLLGASWYTQWLYPHFEATSVLLDIGRRDIERMVSEGWSWELGTGERPYGATYLYTRRPYITPKCSRSWHFDNLVRSNCETLISHYAQRRS